MSATPDAASSSSDRRQRDYFVTRTVLQVPEYGHAADAIVARLGFTRDDYARAGGLAVLRCTVVDPFLATQTGRTDFLTGFAAALGTPRHRRGETLLARPAPAPIVDAAPVAGRVRIAGGRDRLRERSQAHG